MELYEFAFRGLLVEEALDAAGRLDPQSVGGEFDADIANKLSVGLLDTQFTRPAAAMAAVYVAIAAFENSARDLVTRVLVDNFGERWWDTRVSDKVRTHCQTRQADEERHRFHTQRGDAQINYTELKHLLSIIRGNWTYFEPFLPSQDWAASVFDTIERSRNVIMHSGSLDLPDVERLGINIRDWVAQVGT